MDFKAIDIARDEFKIQADLYGDFKDGRKNLIILAHGLGGEKQCGLDQFAHYYQKLGFNVCVFDHSGFGKSTGAVKNLVDKNSQIRDWKTVIRYFEQHHQISSKQMILWGYSFSGGHVLTLASAHPFKAVISNFPHVDGLASLTLYPKKYLLPATILAVQDLVLARVGKVKTMPVVAQDQFAILAGADCYDGYHAIIPAQLQWDNAVPARIVATIGLYRPISVVQKIEMPTLIIGAQNDSLIPIKSIRKTANKIKNSVYFEASCGHFDIFNEPFKSQILEQHRLFLAQL